MGYPWESREEALNIVNLAKKLLERGWAVTLQATVVIPYPGTLLFTLRVWRRGGSGWILRIRAGSM